MNWIPYTSPPTEYHCLVYAVKKNKMSIGCKAKKAVHAAHFVDGKFEPLSHLECFEEVTHWMPMPLPPQEK